MPDITSDLLLEAADHLSGDAHFMKVDRADAVAAWLRSAAAKLTSSEEEREPAQAGDVAGEATGTALHENMERLGNGFYIVRTQAGFRKALKRYIANSGNGSLAVREISGFPKAYPALVSFDICYQGYDYVSANCLPMQELAAVWPTPNGVKGSCNG